MSPAQPVRKATKRTACARFISESSEHGQAGAAIRATVRNDPEARRCRPWRRALLLRREEEHRAPREERAARDETDRRHEAHRPRALARIDGVPARAGAVARTRVLGLAALAHGDEPGHGADGDPGDADAADDQPER